MSDTAVEYPNEEHELEEHEGSWVRLIACKDESELSLVEMTLNSEGIDYVIRGEFMARNEPWLRLSGAIETLIVVPADQHERGEQALRQASIAERPKQSRKITMPLSLKLAFLLFASFFLWVILDVTDLV